MKPRPSADIESLIASATDGQLFPADAARLLSACKADPGVLERLADSIAMDRLITLVHDDPEGVATAMECETRLLESLRPDDEASWKLAWQINEEARQITWRRHFQRTLMAAAAVVLVGLSCWLAFSAFRSAPDAKTLPRIIGLSGAEFREPGVYGLNDPLPLEKEAVLKRGLAQIGFPNGTTAILRGPAVFSCRSLENLEIDLGHCSVHAPPGAEGFTLTTPMVNVVDRGTRFALSVDESGFTEVHVVEGKVDLQSDDGSPPRRLEQGSAARLTRPHVSAAQTIPFTKDAFRRRMPDRIVSWSATLTPEGFAENLKSVSVRRGGQIFDYAYEELIHADVTAFKTNVPGNRVHFSFVEKSATPEQKRRFLSDASLVTGIINPGGSVRPLTSAPVIGRGAADTPGMAIRFQSPVVNGPGPDIVLFELQSVANPSSGDAFHICPLDFSDGKHALTVRRFDLVFDAPESLNLRPFYTEMIADPVASLDELLSARGEIQPLYLDFRILAVTIDLSGMGVRDGESVESLFIQDAPSESKSGELEAIIDPVFIGGLPPLRN